VPEKYSLTAEIKEKFFVGGEYVLEGRFADVCDLVKKAARFIASFCGDPFLVDEVQEMRSLIEEIGSSRALSDVGHQLIRDVSYRLLWYTAPCLLCHLLSVSIYFTMHIYL